VVFNESEGKFFRKEGFTLFVSGRRFGCASTKHTSVEAKRPGSGDLYLVQGGVPSVEQQIPIDIAVPS
jgi:hypothetical protein